MDALDKIKALTEQQGTIAIKAMNDAMLLLFKDWAQRFPTKRLQVVSGMGTYTYNVGDNDFDLNGIAEYQSRHDARLIALFPLVVTFDVLYNEMYDYYNCFDDFLYNPLTRTIEQGAIITYLDKA